MNSKTDVASPVDNDSVVIQTPKDKQALTVDQLIDLAKWARKELPPFERDVPDGLLPELVLAFLGAIVGRLFLSYGADPAIRFCKTLGCEFMVAEIVQEVGEEKNATPEERAVEGAEEIAAPSGAEKQEGDSQLPDGHVVCKKCSAIAPFVGGCISGLDFFCSRRCAGIDDDEPSDRCTHAAGHDWIRTGTADGGDDPSYHGEGRIYCGHCGADGDA